MTPRNEAAERLLVETADTLRMNLNDFSLYGKDGDAERAWIQQSIDDLIAAARAAEREPLLAALRELVEPPDEPVDAEGFCEHGLIGGVSCSVWEHKPWDEARALIEQDGRTEK